MVKPNPRVPGKSVDLFEKHLEAHPDIERKGALNPYTSVNGNMFSILNKKGELGLRLSAQDRKDFIGKHETELFVSYNTVMKEYVRVPEDLLESETFTKYLDKSYEYAKSLKPKPTKRKK